MKAKFLISFLLLSTGLTGFCTTWTITNSGTTFTPSSITIILGDSVEFVIAAAHNAVEVSQATWNANDNTPLPGGFQVPFGGGLVLPAQLGEGVHYYVCNPHAPDAMKGIIMVQNNVGIAENHLQTTISFYPNPVTEVLNININNASDEFSVARLTDVAGKEIYSSGFKLKAGENNLSVPIRSMNIERGIYFMSFKQSNSIITRKVVIQ
ncbi:MAG TPA: T9SS type A sorting domain-containing protein [Bacteroidia bacterium]|nr:T9SS type A sorting domain-containing protein [Bacteroidia bacterium]